EHRIKLFCLPPHTTHLLQPLDVGLFAPLQKFYGIAVDKVIRRGDIALHKGNFLPLYLEVREKAYTTPNIKASWETAGIWPFNPRKVLNRLPEYGYVEQTPNTAQCYEKNVIIEQSSNLLPQTPKSTSSMLRMVRQQHLKAK